MREGVEPGEVSSRRDDLFLGRAVAIVVEALEGEEREESFFAKYGAEHV